MKKQTVKIKDGFYIIYAIGKQSYIVEFDTEEEYRKTKEKIKNNKKLVYKAGGKRSEVLS